jgi:hypothetical protein
VNGAGSNAELLTKALFLNVKEYPEFESKPETEASLAAIQTKAEAMAAGVQFRYIIPVYDKFQIMARMEVYDTTSSPQVVYVTHLDKLLVSSVEKKATKALVDSVNVLYPGHKKEYHKTAGPILSEHPNQASKEAAVAIKAKSDKLTDLIKKAIEKEASKSADAASLAKTTLLSDQLAKGTVPAALLPDKIAEVLSGEEAVKLAAKGSAQVALTPSPSPASSPAQPATPHTGWHEVAAKKAFGLTPVALCDATSLYQPVKGTSATSIYYVIAMYADGLRLAFRKNNSDYSFRAEYAPSSQSKHKGFGDLETLGFSVKPGYASIHMGAHMEEQKDPKLPKKVIGAMLAAIERDPLTPMPKPSYIINKKVA